MLGIGLLVVAAAVLLAAKVLLSPPRMTDGKAAWVLKRISPGDLQMPFEEVPFDVRDEQTGKPIAIAAWWIPAAEPSENCVVMIHGYADAKVGALAWAPAWRELGYNILAIDLRAHGHSGGRHTTAGFFERHDVDQVINRLRADRPEQTRQLVLFGISLGAAVALATAERRDDIAALVLECPFADYRRPVTQHARVIGMPLPSLTPLVIRAAEWISGADFDAVRPIDLLERVAPPVMVIHASDDPFVPDSDANAMKEIVLRRGGEYWPVPHTSHLMCLVADPAEYHKRIREFLVRCGHS